MNKPPTDWTPEEIRRVAASVHELGFMVAEEMLCHFAAMLEAEARGERCVLPPDILRQFRFQVRGDLGRFEAETFSVQSGAHGTMQSAIVALAEKLKGTP